MPATQTPKKAAPRRPAPTGTLVSPTMRRFRPIVTTIAIILLIVAGFDLALSLGQRQGIVFPVAMVLVSMVLAVAAQSPRLYVWADSGPGPVVEHAAQARAAKLPKQRRGELTLPTLKPAPELGAEFRYIVLFGRHVMQSRPELIAQMDDVWDSFDWDADNDPFVEAYEYVLGLAKAYPGWNASVKREQSLAGTFDRANPFPFVAELESYHVMIGAIAMLMLVRSNPSVSRADYEQVLEPWIRLRLPYRQADTVFVVDKTGEYKTSTADPFPAAPAPAAPVAGQVRNGSSAPGGTLDDVLAVFSAPAQPAPKPATPAPAAELDLFDPFTETPIVAAPAPAPAAEPKHVEADQDDVPEPTADQILHAVELVISSQFGSVPMLQRKMRIGFMLATKVMHRLFVYDLVGPRPDGGGARDVMVPTEELDDTLDFIREQEAERRQQH